MKKLSPFKVYALTSVLIVGLAIAGFISMKTFTRPDLTVMGYINMKDGLGRQGPELIEAFKKKLNVAFKYTRKIKNVKVPKEINKIVNKKSTKWGKVLIFEDILWGPWDGSAVDKLRNCPKDTIKIAYSMYEATKIPHEWVDILNNKFDAVIVPSKFLIEVYQNSGVQIPIFKIPLGLNLKSFLKEPLKAKCGDKFVFGNLSAGSDRKNHVMLIRAFAKAFGDDPSVQLLINARYSEKEVRNEITKTITLLDLDNIKFTQKPLSKGNYIVEFKKIDCYVSPSKGEGFSIQPREAMALGIPVIATNNTGQIEVCNSGLVEVVNSPIKKPAINPWGDYYGFNFDCHIDELAVAMKRVKENYDEYLAKRSEARKWASKYQYSELESLYWAIIKPKSVRFRSENSIRLGRLVTNSMPLFLKYQKLLGKKATRASNESVFTGIYKTAAWGRNEEGKGFSGDGSVLENATPYVSFLEEFIKKNDIQSVVDLGCGDWTLSQHLNWSGIQYIGIDVVKFVIENNQKLYSAPNIRFIHADATQFDLPEGDLLICKDVLQHLSNEDILKILKQRAKFKHCLFVNDVTRSNSARMNAKIDSGELRPLDLSKAPFYLKGEKVLKYLAHHNNEKVVFHVSK